MLLPLKSAELAQLQSLCEPTVNRIKERNTCMRP